MFAFAVFDGFSGSNRPLAASSPVQSCAPTITSGAFSALTVPRSLRIWPKSFSTTLTVRPLDCAQAVATDVTAGLRSLSAQMTIWVAAARFTAVGAAVPLGRAEAAATSSSTAALAASATSASREMRFVSMVYLSLTDCGGAPTPEAPGKNTLQIA